MIDNLEGEDRRCKYCSIVHLSRDGRDGSEGPNYDGHPINEYITHNVSVTWISRWEVSCLCGWKCIRGLDSKLTAELIGWLHLRRWSLYGAQEFAQNRGISELVYN